MPHVELVYDADCPNIEAARKALREAFTEAQLDPEWTEWDRKTASAPPHVRHYGSPTILVNGRDVAGGARGQNGADCCRLYRDASGAFRGAPDKERIVAALNARRSA